MTILYVITNLFQLLILVTLTGILVSVAAVSRLMEVVINLVHPVTIFLLHQSGQLIVWLVSQTAGLTSCAFRKACATGHVEAGRGEPTSTAASGSPEIKLNMTSPDIPYARSAFPGLVGETEAVVDPQDLAGDRPDDEPGSNQKSSAEEVIPNSEM